MSPTGCARLVSLCQPRRPFCHPYDDYGRAVPPGEYVIQAVAGTAGASVTSAVHVTVQEDALIHGRVEGRQAGDSGDAPLVQLEKTKVNGNAWGADNIFCP